MKELKKSSKKKNNQKKSFWEEIKVFAKRLFRDKRFRHGGAALLLTVLFAAALVLINIITSLAVRRVPALSPDISKNSVYTLSDETLSLLRSLDEDVQIWIFASEASCEETTSDFDPLGQVPKAHELIKRYAQYSGHISIIYADLSAQPGYLDLFDEYRDAISSYSVAVTSSRRTRVTSFYEFLPSLSGTTVTDETSVDTTSSMTEMYISSLIKTVTLDITPSVVFLDGVSGGSEAVSLLTALSLNGYDVSAVDFRTEAIPQEADMIILSAPSADLTLDQCDRIERFLANGGELGKSLIVFNSVFMPETPNLTSLLSDWGVNLERKVVYEGDQTAVVAGASPAAFRPGYSQNVYTSSLIERNIGCMVENALLLEIPSAVRGDLAVEPILATSELGYLGDLLSQTVSDEAGRRVIMTGSTLYANNANGDQIRSDVFVAPLSLCYSDYLGNTSTYANYALLMSVCNRRCGIVDENLEIPSKLLTDVDFSMSDSSINACTVIFSYIIPLLISAAGVFVYIRRRRL